MKSKVAGYIALGIGIAIFVGFFSLENQNNEREDNEIFHVTLADPKKYENGKYSDSFEIAQGNYSFRFVPNGDSPKNLKISLAGESIQYFENFVLDGTLHETGVSSYYTWDYLGNKKISIANNQEIEIIIDPNGHLLGPVSVDIIRE